MVMVLALYDADATRFGRTSQAIAELMSVAHELTGEPVMRSLRFAVIPDTPESVAQLQDGLRRDDERVMHLFVLGAPDVGQLGRITRALDTAAKGTRVVARAATLTPQETLPSAQELKALVMQAAERP
jgi:hypothetical protein